MPERWLREDVERVADVERDEPGRVDRRWLPPLETRDVVDFRLLPLEREDPRLGEREDPLLVLR